jgi:hypothetical protein
MQQQMLQLGLAGRRTKQQYSVIAGCRHTPQCCGVHDKQQQLLMRGCRSYQGVLLASLAVHLRVEYGAWHCKVKLCSAVRHCAAQLLQTAAECGQAVDSLGRSGVQHACS